jgi:hypothetical protein
MLLKYPPPTEARGIRAFPASTPAEDADAALPSLDDTATDDSDTQLCGDFHSQPVEFFQVRHFCDRIEEARLPGAPVYLRIPTDSGRLTLQIASNCNLERIARLALEMCDAEDIEICISLSPEDEEILIYERELCDAFPGSMPDIEALDGFVEDRCGATAAVAYTAWINLLPRPEDVPALHPKAQENLIRTLEALAGKTKFAYPAHEAAHFLLSIPGYSPESGSAPNWLWEAQTDGYIFQEKTGLAAGDIHSVDELLDAVRDKKTKAVNSVPLILFLTYSKRLGNADTAKNILNPFLDTEIPELSDSKLASLGDEALQAIAAIDKRRNGISPSRA